MNKVITIGREFGSGGKYIGEKLAKELGYYFYDKELLKKVSEQEKIDLNLLEKIDENQKNSFWYTLALGSLCQTTSVNSLTELPINDQYFLLQSKVIEEIAQKEDCVIIGRCSNVILQNKTNVTNIFVYSSDVDFKINRKMEFENLKKEDAIRKMKKIDKERAAYYHYYTNQKWGARDSYDLLIDVSKIGVDNTVELIKHYMLVK